MKEYCKMKKILISLLSVIMVACMALTLAACGENDPNPSVIPSAGTSVTLTPSTADPTTNPTTNPTDAPVNPTDAPVNPTVNPTDAPVNPTVNPTDAPVNPTVNPTDAPVNPTVNPTVEPSVEPTTPAQNLYANIVAAIEAGKYDNLELNVPLGVTVAKRGSNEPLPTKEEFDFLDMKGDAHYTIVIEGYDKLGIGSEISTVLQNVNVSMIRSGATFSLKLRVSVDTVCNYKRLGEGAVTYTEGHWTFASEDGTVKVDVPYSDGRELLDIDKETDKVVYLGGETNVFGSAQFFPGTLTVDTDKIEEGTTTESETQILYFTESGIYVADNMLGENDSEDNLLFHYGSWDYVLDQFVKLLQEDSKLNLTAEDIKSVFAAISAEWEKPEVQAALQDVIASVLKSFEMTETENGYELTFSADLAPFVNTMVGILKENGETPLYTIINNIYLAATEKEEGDVATDLKAMLPAICAFSVEDAFTELEKVLAQNGTSLDAVVEELLPYVNKILAMLPAESLPEGIELPMAKDTAMALITMVRAQYGETTVADIVKMLVDKTVPPEGDVPPSVETDPEAVEPSVEPSEAPFDAVAYLSAMIDQGKAMLSEMTIKGLLEAYAGEGVYDMVTSFHAKKIEGTLTFTFDTEYRLVSGTFAYEVNVGLMAPAATDEGEPVYQPLLPGEDGTLSGEYVIEIAYGDVTITLPTKLIPNDPEETYDFVTAPEKDNLVVTIDGELFVKVETNYAYVNFSYVTEDDGRYHYSKIFDLGAYLTVTKDDAGNHVITVKYQDLAAAVKAQLATDVDYLTHNCTFDNARISFYLYDRYEEGSADNHYAYYSVTISQE